MSSMPAEMRAKPSPTGSPHLARRSTDVWMPPKLVDEIFAAVCPPSHKDMEMWIVRVPVVDSNPVQTGVEVVGHLAHQVTGI